MFCTQCGNKLSDGAKFCAKCGHKVQEEIPAEVAGSNTTNAPEIKKQETVVEEQPKKKSKLWLWILLFKYFSNHNNNDYFLLIASLTPLLTLYLTDFTGG